MLRRIASAVVLASLAVASLACGTALAAVTPTSATIAWTAPGDDGNTGTASQYDVRLSTAAITAGNFASATHLTGAPAPAAAGSTQSMNLTGLSPSTTYWCAIKTADEAGNWSAISNIVTFTTPSASDTIRPAALALAPGTTTQTSVALTWTATGDDSLTGTANHYEVRWSKNPITPANFASATQVTSGVPAPAAPGTSQGCTVTGLDRSTDTYFAARLYDEANNPSALSNVVQVGPWLDTAPPATPSGLAGNVALSGVHLHWSANSEPDLAGYHVYRATAANGSYVRIDVSTVGTNDYTDTAAPDSASLWYAVSAVDAVGNESARGAGVQVWLSAVGVTATTLQPAYPNPSGIGSPVTLPVAVAPGGPSDGRIDILNAAGERVRSLDLRGLAPGTNLVTWDGHNDAGRVTAPGAYHALLTLGSTQHAIRLVRR